MDFNTVKDFEDLIAEYFDAPYAIAVDCCTHGLELCLRRNRDKVISVPHRTYLSVPFLAEKLGIDLVWKDVNWKDYYYLTNEIIDAAVLWKEGSYIPGTFMCLSFQFQKHLSLGKGGMILTDNKNAAKELKRMSYDGRHPDIPWRQQDISTIGYHYYMTPETAELGLTKFAQAYDEKPKQWVVTDWPDLTKMEVFKKSEGVDPYLQTR